MLESYPDLLTLKQVEEIFNCKRFTSLKLVTEREIQGFKIAGRWMVSKESVIEYIREQLDENEG